jgi:ADP-dependent NAD(P)H-hydrate dehydratase
LSQEIKVTTTLIKSLIVPRLANSKKGDNGIVLIVGGNKIYHGAPILASTAAMRCGTDLVYMAVPRSNILSTRALSPNAIVLPLPDDKLTLGAANRLTSMLPKRPDSAAIGMGMTIAKPEALKALVKRLRINGTKLLLDAAALIPAVLDDIAGTDTIITPHPGEYKRIFGEDVGKDDELKLMNVQKMTQKYQITIVLKGPVNVVCDSHNKFALIKRSTPAMTVGGTGDILSGLAGGFLSKMNPFDACLLGVYFNGAAASLAYRRLGLHIVATDIVDEIPNVLKEYDTVVQ